MLAHVVSNSLSGVALCLMTAMLTFSYLKLAGVFTGERQGR